MQSSNVIGIPESSAAFEDRCCILFRRHVNDPNLKGVATQGSDQEGIDLIGCRDGDPHRPVTVQCKLKRKKDKLSPAEAKVDIIRALAIEPPLTEIYVVTTAPDSIELDKLAIEVRQEQVKQGRIVDIQIWGWDELQRRIRQFPEAIRAFDPDYSATSQELLDVGHETLSVVQDTASEIAGLGVGQEQMASDVRKLLAAMQMTDTGSGRLIDSIFDAQIDQYRDLLNAGKVQTAADLLQRMEEGLPAEASDVVRARIKANLGFAQLRQGDDQGAAVLLKQAFDLSPDDSRFRANRLLALILEGRASEALEGSRILLAEDPDNAGAASYAYQAASQLDDVESPDAFVPAELLKDENTAINRLNFLRKHAPTMWLQEAKEVAEAHTDSSIMKRFLADAILENAFADRAQGLTAEELESRRKAILEGADLLQQHWDEVRHFENAGLDVWMGVAANLITAYRVVHCYSDARRVGEQALAKSSDATEVRLALAHVEIAEDKPAAALSRVEKLPESSHRTLLMLSALAELERWGEALSFATPERVEVIAGQDRAVLDNVLARAKLGAKTSDPETVIEGLIAKYPDDLNVLAASAHLARQYAPQKLGGIKEALLSRLDERSPYTARLMAAELAVASDDPAEVIEALDGHVDGSRPSEPLAWLAWAFANAAITPRVRAFFEGLSPDVLKMPRIARLAGAAAGRRGDLPAAERHLLDALAGDPPDLRSRLMLHGVYERLDRRADAQDLIRAASESEAKGSPDDRMRLALLLMRAGETERAFALGFEVCARNRADEAAISKYFGLFFADEQVPAGVATPARARVGDWFELREVDGDRITEGLLGDEQVPEVVSYPTAHGIGREVFDREVGHEIVIKQAFGEDRRYTLTALKHRYVWLLHEILRTHDTRFPESTSISSLTIKNDDLQPVFDLARRHQQQSVAIRQQYEEMAIPLEALAGAHRKNVLQVSELITQNGGEIRTCAGDHEERIRAEKLCSRHRGKGVVLDTLTAWHAFHLDLLPSLKSYFGSLAIAQSTLDDLIEARALEEVNVGREYMTLGYEGDQAVRQTHSAEETARRVAVFNDAIRGLRSICDVLPTDGSDDPELAQLNNRDLLAGILDPINLARQTGGLLLSEDMHYRQLARSELGSRSSWLQAACLAMLRSGDLDQSAYALCCARLSAMRHGHVSLHAQTLLELLLHDNWQPLIRAAANYIGGPRAEIVSHAYVVADFMNQACARSPASWQAAQASGTLITALLKGREDWREALSYLELALGRTGAIGFFVSISRGYLREWVRGHFLDSPLIAQSTGQAGEKLSSGRGAKGRQGKRRSK